MMHFIKKVVRELDSSSAADFKAYKRYTKEGRQAYSLARWLVIVLVFRKMEVGSSMYFSVLLLLLASFTCGH